MLIFIFYRIFEKLFKVRLESKIGFALFWIIKFKHKITLKERPKVIEDKRLLWGLMRYDDFNKYKTKKYLENRLKLSLEYGTISFENSMETSIRGINLITLSLIDENFHDKNKSFINDYLRACNLNNILCPDIYLKKSNFRFINQSNNHRFYNLLFKEYYNLFKHRKVSFNEIVCFIDKRLIENSFFDEGSSFYHYGVIKSIENLLNLVKANNADCNQSILEKINFLKINNEKELFKDLNFGDRDGTLTLDPLPNEVKIEKTIINNSKFYISNISSVVSCIRKENWTDFGTEGHIHDDAGMITYRSNESSLLDIGTYLYLDEPKYCKLEHHNFPYDIDNNESIYYKSKFERIPSRNIKIIEENNSIKIKKIFNKYELLRNFSTIDHSFSDEVIFFDKTKIKINWNFYFTHLPKVDTKQNIITIPYLGEFIIKTKMKISISPSNYFPDYGKTENCYLLKIETEEFITRNSQLITFNLYT